MNMQNNHGLWKEFRREYQCWQDIKQRCRNPNNKYFKDYGGRGISICKEWENDFCQFVKDMSKRPEGMSIDRIDNDKGYNKENCRWATRTQQSRNTRLTNKDTAGIYFQDGKFVAQITVSHRTIKIGSFENLEDAKHARSEAVNRYWINNEPAKARGTLLKNNKSGFTGVYLNKRYNHWTAYYGGQGNRKHIGCFKSKEEAAEARKNWMKAHGITDEC